MFCRSFKVMISHAADIDRPVGGITQRHIEGCENCRRFYENCRSLGEVLRAEAIDLNGAYPLSAEQITQNIALSSKRPHHKSVKLGYFAAAACIVLAVTAAVVFMSRPPEHQTAEEQAISINDLLGSDLQTTWSGLLEEPLTGEMKNLASDTESAVRFLVACVDADPLQNGTTHKVD